MTVNFKQLERVHASALTLGASVFLVSAYNLSFWKSFVSATGGISLDTFPLHLAAFIILVAFFNGMLTLVAFRPFFKPVLITLFIITSGATYFMDRYGILIDAVMIQNAYETDLLESAELASWRLALVISLLGLLPSWLVWRAKVHFLPLRQDVWIKIKVVLVSFTVCIVLLLVFFKSFAPILREHRGLRFMLTPTNYIQAANSFVKRKFSKPRTVMPIGTDAIKGAAWKTGARKTITIIVVGETARAMNFSLNGYGRDTNPELSGQPGLINFSNVQSCGTATAVSVPCVFSSLGRERYSDEEAKSREGLLDVLAHAGFNVIWKDNNSGCKGVCDRVQYEDFSQPVAGDPLCTSEECHDEILLRKLPETIRSSEKDLVIVLHQKGSHGPAYWKRYPNEFNRFGPACKTSDLQKCSTESIVNGYDNTILYTDHFLSRTIDILRKSAATDNIDTAFVYFSDHGESLGENNLFLHGAPYLISPIEQRHVPFMLWFSDGFLSRFRIDAECLARRSALPYSHDNVFHSILGMLNVNTAAYMPAQDMFKTCSRAI